MKKIWIYLAASIFVALVPAFIYLSYFGINHVSENPSDWGTFGDFIGGTVNTLIGIISLLVLAWLSYTVAKNSNEEARNHQFLVRQMDAYDRLTNYAINSPIIFRKINAHAGYILNLQEKDCQTHEHWAEYNRNVSIELNPLFEMCYYVTSFETMSGHLFSYDFTSQKFKDLQTTTATLNKYLEEIEKIYTAKLTDIKIEADQPEIINFSLQFDEFMKSLKKEISHTKNLNIK
ncbi:MAG: hypothetical protein QE487_06655 [Fluviicola sp.]|nr:hypothetical protein [Fluviicola sp.]